MLTFQQIILTLQSYWDKQGCALLQPIDMEVGAGTSHVHTFLRAIGPEPWRAAYVQPSRRPKDGRYGENPNRLQHYYQYQVVLKPAPENILDLYLGSLRALGFDLKQNDVRFVEDDWENPTLGAWGLGWEVWLNGMEVTQFTYFQQVGGLDCKPVLGEITYGLERLAMYLQKVENVYDLVWTEWEEPGPAGSSVRRRLTYGDVYHQNEVEQSAYNFEHANVEWLFALFGACEAQAKRMIGLRLALPAYELVLKAAHTFNLLDARGAISVTERAAYIGRIRALSRNVAQAYHDSREQLGFPMLGNEARGAAGLAAGNIGAKPQPGGLREPLEPQGPQEHQEPREQQAPQEPREHRALRERQEPQGPREHREPREQQAPQEPREHQPLRERQEPQGLRELQEQQTPQEPPEHQELRKRQEPKERQAQQEPGKTGPDATTSPDATRVKPETAARSV